ncbi:MAG: NUDIX hydrolase [Thermodesulfobacteriota bacterium]
MVTLLKKAATIILLRNGNPEGFEVFLLKRHEKSSFMGGNFVYPGGRLDREDASLEISRFSKGVTPDEAQRILGGTISPEESFAHWIGGIRELFEEAGILFAYDSKGHLIKMETKEDQKKFSNYRTLLQKGGITLSEIAKEENILLALDQLHYYAHWITPVARSERFDTRFFLACLPLEQVATHDQKETTEAVWLAPQDALQENLRGRMALSPPTLKTLEDLSRFKRIEDIFLSLKEKSISAILPILTKISDEPTIIFPWDPEYEEFHRGGFSPSVNRARPSNLGDHTTRLLLRKGIWYPYCYAGSS